MKWYWWVLIGVAVAAIGYLKIRYFQNMSQKEKTKPYEKDD